MFIVVFFMWSSLCISGAFSLWSSAMVATLQTDRVSWATKNITERETTSLLSPP